MVGALVTLARRGVAGDTAAAASSRERVCAVEQAFRALIMVWEQHVREIVFYRPAYQGFGHHRHIHG